MEFVYFYITEELNEEEFAKIDAAAWNDGLLKANPKENHRNSDVVLYIIADMISPAKTHKKAVHFKNYQFGLHGFSNYRLVTIEVSSGRKITNYQGKAITQTLVRYIIFYFIEEGNTMEALLIILVAIALLVIGYIFYGGVFAKQWGVNPDRETLLRQWKMAWIISLANLKSFLDIISHQ